MKELVKALLCLIVIVGLQSAAFGQIGYSLTDNNRDVSGLDQQYYQFDLATGSGTLITNLVVNGQTVRREYEGLASIGSTLYAISEFDTALCNTGSDPLTGLSSDLRTFRTPSAAYPVNNIPNAVGPQIGETCFPAGYTESAAAYNPGDGFIYAIASDDQLPANDIRSGLYRVSTSTGLATRVGNLATPVPPPGGPTTNRGIIKTATCTGVNVPAVCSAGGEENPYLDGLAILPDGRIFATASRLNDSGAFHGGMYRLFATGGNAGRAQWIGYLNNGIDINEDTGLANSGNAIYMITELGPRLWTISDTVPTAFGGAPKSVLTAAVLPGGGNTMTAPGCLRLPVCGDFEGFDIPSVPLR